MDIKKILAETNLRPDKMQGQYFLQDDEIIEYEIKLAELERNDVVLEIGAGIGNVTEKIAKKSKVIAVERDKRFIPLLEKLQNTEIINDDALRVIKNLSFNKVISNIPYAISQKLLLELLKREWQIAVLMVQREFAKKLKNGKLAVLLNECAEMKIIGNIAADVFYPRGVASSIIVLRQKQLVDEKFWIFLNSAYRNKNKDVKNVFPGCDEAIARKKVHMLTSDELRSLYQRVKTV